MTHSETSVTQGGSLAHHPLSLCPTPVTAPGHRTQPLFPAETTRPSKGGLVPASVQKLASYHFSPESPPPACRGSAPGVDCATGLGQGQQLRSWKTSGTGPSHSQPRDRVHTRTDGAALGATGSREEERPAGADRQKAEPGRGVLKHARFPQGLLPMHQESLGLASCHQPVLVASQGPHPPAGTVMHPTLAQIQHSEPQML